MGPIDRSIQLRGHADPVAGAADAAFPDRRYTQGVGDRAHVDIVLWQGVQAMKSSRMVQLAIFAMVVFCGTETAFANPIYSFTTIDVPGASETFAGGINNSGQIVGSFNVFGTLMTHGFLDINGSFTTIDFPGATGATNAYGINNTGQIVGVFSGTGGLAQGFLDTGGSFKQYRCPRGNSHYSSRDQRQRPDRGMVRHRWLLGDTWFLGDGRQLQPAARLSAALSRPVSRCLSLLLLWL
ncbi:MAG: hypothetical protein JO307_22755 [Bryobacterales bacterium]|nr:hypothetical protein [Bryobacterales bacterium]